MKSVVTGQELQRQQVQGTTHRVIGPTWATELPGPSAIPGREVTPSPHAKKTGHPNKLVDEEVGIHRVASSPGWEMFQSHHRLPQMPCPLTVTPGEAVLHSLAKLAIRSTSGEQ